MTVTGRIIDGNCTFSWRKQGGLLTITGWSGYGNWMVYWRKLDGQLTETGRPIDGSCQADYLHFRGQKMRFYVFVKSTFQGYQAACQEIWRMYQASCKEIFCSFAVRKCDCCRFLKLTFQGTSQRVWIFFMFEAWKCDFAQSWNQRFKGTKFRGSNFSASTKLRVNKLSAFVCLKMLFLPIRETNVSRYLAKRGIF